MNTSEIIGKYIEYRDFLAKRQEAFDLEIKPYQDAMTVLSGAMQLQLIEAKEESVRTEAGTAYLSTTLHARVKDRDALMNFIRESDEFDLLTAAVSKDAVKAYLEEHQSQLPPGVEVTYITKCQFRRAS